VREPTTDPRASDPLPLAIVATAAWVLRREARAGAELCERLSRSARDPDVGALAAALQRVLYSLANLGIAASKPAEPVRVGVIRRVWRALW